MLHLNATKLGNSVVRPPLEKCGCLQREAGQPRGTAGSSHLSHMKNGKRIVNLVASKFGIAPLVGVFSAPLLSALTQRDWMTVWMLNFGETASDSPPISSRSFDFTGGITFASGPSIGGLGLALPPNRL